MFVAVGFSPRIKNGINIAPQVKQFVLHSIWRGSMTLKERLYF